MNLALRMVNGSGYGSEQRSLGTGVRSSSSLGSARTRLACQELERIELPAALQLERPGTDWPVDVAVERLCSVFVMCCVF